MSNLDRMYALTLKEACVANYGDNAINLLCELGGDPDMVICDYAAHCTSVSDNIRSMFRGAGIPTAFGAHESIIREIKRRYFAGISRNEAEEIVRHIGCNDCDMVCICPGEPGLTFGPSAYADAWHAANPTQDPII